MESPDYDDVIDRITKIYSSCLPNEQRVFESILQEVADKGYSNTLEQIWLKDFVEVPVSIDTFISDSLYLGETNDNGSMVYPFWKEALEDIFTESKSYSEIVFSGATRIGKTSTAITGMAYMLYRLMIYRNPHKFFRKKSVSKFTVAFANLTKDLAKGVGYREFNTTLKQSEWFNRHGKFSQSESNYYYIPDGDRIEIIPASDSAHLLGKQLWCLSGDTVVCTSKGNRRLESLVDQQVRVRQYNPKTRKTELSKAKVVLTKYAYRLTTVLFTNGMRVTGTPEHKLMLITGRYEELEKLQPGNVMKAKPGSDPCVVESVSNSNYVVPVPVYDVVNVEPHHNFLIYDKTSKSYVVSHNCLLMDEVNFARAGIKDVNKAKVQMKQMYDTGNARITGTFKIRGQVYGKMFTCSSKNSDSDYLSDHIESQLNAGNTSLYLVDEPQWKVLPPEMFSTDTFYIAVGDRYKKGFVVSDENSDETHLQAYRDEGYNVVEVPRDFLSNFKSDFDISLRDIAGIAVVGAMGFITQESVTVNVSTERKNPFLFDIIVCGTSDNETIERNFHSEYVPHELKHMPMYVHVDFAEVSDHTGICGVVCDGTKVIFDELTNKKVVMPSYSQVFQVAIEAPRGDRMSFQKVINFLVWLRRSGFNVRKVTTDQYQSSYVRETLKQQGFDVDKVSVDSSEDPYIALRNVLQDQRISLVKHELQEDELVHLKRMNGRIDHPPQSSTSDQEDNYSRSGPPGNGYGKGVGKDCADALAGSLWTAIQDGGKPEPTAKQMTNMIASLNGRGSYSSRVPSVMNIPGRFGK